METKYKSKQNNPDLYEILGLTQAVCSESNCEDLIYKAYKKKAKEYHPDRHPGSKDMADRFERVSRAYNILKNASDRAEYNQKMKLTREATTDYFTLKRQAEDYRDLIGDYVPPSEQQLLDFKNNMRLENAKHGYDTTRVDAIPVKEAESEWQKRLNARLDEDVQLKPQKLFDPEKVDGHAFNAIWEKYHAGKQKTGLVPHSGVPEAFNASGCMGSNFGDFDSNNLVSHLYSEGAGNFCNIDNQSYANVDFGGVILPELSQEQIKEAGTVDYYTSHNKRDEKYYRDLKAKLQERESESTLFDGMKYDDFKRDDTMGYGIFDKLGYTVTDSLEFDPDSEDLMEKYTRMVAAKEESAKESVKAEKKPVKSRRSAKK